MSRNYDNWERIVQAVLKREQYRQLAYASSRSSSISSSTVSDYGNNISRSELYQNRFMAWQKGELLGRGSFASVYEGFDEDGFFFAVKEVSLLYKGDEEKISIIQLEQEIALLSQMEHENIVQYYGTEKVESHFYIFLELVTGGSLLSLYQKHDLLDLQVSAYTRQILHGLKYLHDKNVVHRNIKCANILVDANGSVKLADFGITKATKLRDVNAPFWMAPEVVRRQGFGLASDIWSLGCIVLEMLTQRFPYSNMEPCILADQQISTIYRIASGELPPIPDSLSSDARDFILKCLQVEANARPTASELLDHPFVKRSFPAFSRGSSFSSISSSYRFGPGSPFHEQNIHEASSTVNDTDWGRLLYRSLPDAPISLDGQLEFICKTLGFSGIEDFGIPVAEYEAMKVRSSASYVSPNEKLRRIIVDWQKGDLLGRGSFGSVYEGITGDGFFFAVKEVYLLDQGDEGKQRIIQLQQEIALLSQFEHENIVQYYGMEKVESRLYIFLELVTKGSLLRLYQKYNLRDSQVSAYTRQILHGLKYLHDKNVVHRDIKCANILVDANGMVKLADFGLAEATKLNDVKSCKGTAFWMAPEVVRSLGYGLAADIWSLGCTVLEMLTRHFPYSNMEPVQALYRIGRGELPPVPVSLSSDARDFILKCLQVDASARPTASLLLDHPFVKQPLPASSGSASPYNFCQRI